MNKKVLTTAQRISQARNRQHVLRKTEADAKYEWSLGMNGMTRFDPQKAKQRKYKCSMFSPPNFITCKAWIDPNRIGDAEKGPAG